MPAKYQIRLAFLIWLVVFSALAFAAIPYLDWALRGFPYHDRHVIVTVDGVTHEIDSRVWPTHHLNPRNRVSAPKPDPIGGTQDGSKTLR
jgi:hypothetical protein